MIDMNRCVNNCQIINNHSFVCLQDIFDTILEKGPQFKELEYMNAVQLLFRSRPGQTKDSLSEYLTKLSSVLGDIGVTV